MMRRRRLNASWAAKARSCTRPCLATQRAEMAFEMFQQVRNKVVGAYQEIMKMQI